MSDSLAWNWSAVRELYQDWGVPADLLDRVLGCAEGTVEHRSEIERWRAAPERSEPGWLQGGENTPDLHRQIVVSFQAQLTRFCTEDQSPDAEKRARALSTLAKTLETIAGIGIKLGAGATGNKGHQQGINGAISPGSEPGDTVELDRQLKELIEQLEESREDR